MTRTSFLLIAIVSLFSAELKAQVLGAAEDETKLYAETKQVNQFFRRFNGEESEKGDRFYPRDKQYRSAKLRKKYLEILFDASSTALTPALKVQFAKDVLEKPETNVLDFHGGNWFSEVHAYFTMNGKRELVTLFLQLEKSHLGSKWVINKVHAGMFDPYFQRDTVRVGRFLHPMSHELDYMNLRKAFQHTDSISQFAHKKFKADQLSVFLYEVNKGNLKFVSVEDVKFHFFQINGWYFSIEHFNRGGYNNGWLISNLVKLNTAEDLNALRKYLYYEK
jgi:hypothetical protein